MTRRCVPFTHTPLLGFETEVLHVGRVVHDVADAVVLEDERVEQLHVPVGVEYVAPVVVPQRDDHATHFGTRRYVVPDRGTVQPSTVPVFIEQDLARGAPD